VYYHIIPPSFPHLKNLFMGNAKKYFKGPITMGKDGMLFFLPPHSSAINVKNVLNNQPPRKGTLVS